MAIGTTADFTLTRNQLIDLSYSLINVTEPTTDEYDLAVKVLNSLVRHLDARGQWLWAIDQTESTLTTVASQQEYTTGAGATNIATDILRLEKVAILENSDDRLPLRILSPFDAVDTVLRDDNTSQPVACTLEPGALRADNKLLLFPTPDNAYTIKYNYRKPLYDFDSATDNPDFPQHFFLPLQKLLAYELAPHYGKPFNERQFLKVEGEQAFAEAVSFSAAEPSYETLKTEFF